MELPTLEDLGDLTGMRVLVRCDFNVPLSAGVVKDDGRIRSSLPTLRYLQDAGAEVTACSHLGRPEGRVDQRFEMLPVVERLATFLPGVQLLENLRFDLGEEENAKETVDRLVDGQDAYVNEAFAASHRAHASVMGPPSRLPCAAGRLLVKEVEVLHRLRSTPRSPFVAILGGAKIDDKIGVIESLVEVVDELLVGGGMCFTFFAAQGIPVGSSLVDDSMVEFCARLLDNGAPIRLPIDVTALGPDGVLGDPSSGGEVRQLGRALPDGWIGVDIGPGSAIEFCDAIADARTCLWNGPMGVFEDERFAAGTRTVAESMADCSGFTVVGGGDSAAAVRQFGLVDRFDHVSTGGGATLEYIEKGDLPGLAALRTEQRLESES